MKENEQEQLVDNEPTMSKKALLEERLKKQYPDSDFSDEENFYGTIGGEMDKLDKMSNAQKELGDLLANDPRSAGFLMVLRKGGNPIEYLLEQYGDAFREALDDKSKAKEFAAAVSKYTEKQAKNKELQEQADANLQTMLDDLDKAQKEGNFSDEDATKAYEYLYAENGLLDRILTNEIGEDDWTLLMKAAKYDDMIAEGKQKVKEARNEGEVVGRNANIDIKKRKRTKADNMPSDVTSGGSRIDVNPKPKNGMIEALDGMRKSVWDD